MAKYQEAEKFFNSAIFEGLADLKPAFESPTIKHFDAADLGVVIECCTLHNVLMIGIEVFTPQAELVGVQIAPEDRCSNAWCVEFLKRFRHQPNLSYCAT